ncbi:tyrosine-protein phosphatase 10D-like isoform X9 [Palaemon carinicauda]|uniref:tyrosine-protein phosphatase 10D-like isoform X9 n=1 Tax=Palaemon carinicauda TaxID=392227 RepID=UPI0035B63E0D
MTFALKNLTPGASCELQLYTVYETKESDAYITVLFTTRPNAPGRFIMWYRNETAILALWHRPHPAGIYSHYQILYQEVETFNGDSRTKVVQDKIDVNELSPGRNYSLSVSAIWNQ